MTPYQREYKADPDRYRSYHQAFLDSHPGYYADHRAKHKAIRAKILARLEAADLRKEIRTLRQQREAQKAKASAYQKAYRQRRKDIRP